MKNIVLSIIIVIAALPVFAQYKPVDNGSSIQFKIKNMGINTSGSFTGLQGTINFDLHHLEESNFDVSIDANTVNTNNEMRDNHLRNDTYFDVTKFPRIHFASTKVAAGNTGELMVYGKLTIKNQTKDISFPFTATATNDGYFFKGAFSMNRRDFAVGGTSIISDNLEVQLNILAKK